MTGTAREATWASSARVTLASQWARLVLQVVGFVVLSRLLPPSDFGLIAMVVVVANLAGLVADFGLSLAGLQADELTNGQKNNLFWLNTAAGAVGAVLIVAGSPALVLFYDEPRLWGIGCVIAGSLLIGGIGVQFRVEINRARRFFALAVQDVVAACAGLVTAVVGALLGWGYWALVLLTVVPVVLTTALAVATAGWRPGRYARAEPIAGLLRFGSHNLLLQLANMLSRSVDVMAVGRAQGATELGLYSRATQLIAMAFQQLVTPLTRVVLPRLVELRKDRERFDAQLVRLQGMISTVLPLLISLLAAVSTPLVVVFLGPPWEKTGEILLVLCTGALMQAVAYIFYWAYLADGRSGVLLLSELPGRAVMIIGAIVAAPAGVTAVAWVMTAGQAVMLVTGTVFAQRLGLPGLRLLRAAVVPVLVCGLAFGASVGAQALISQSTSFTRLLVGAVAWAVPVGAFALVPPVRRHIAAMIGTLRR
ncbi:lipopolysaccharide biosynthesis protein [Microbacterium esteraromaticum]|uniref:oligosaccharide flippase family protein n=1 Tax=Microbacterium esteraromaticum TaxID=57043 RepID=UPI001A8CC765|nr:lipopolysaccharide biosynthesis protein [Microbacterium esteraromaticum]